MVQSKQQTVSYCGLVECKIPLSSYVCPLLAVDAYRNPGMTWSVLCPAKIK